LKNEEKKLQKKLQKKKAKSNNKLEKNWWVYADFR
jgi:hypothetical protein